MIKWVSRSIQSISVSHDLRIAYHFFGMHYLGRDTCQNRDFINTFYYGHNNVILEHSKDFVVDLYIMYVRLDIVDYFQKVYEIDLQKRLWS